MNIQNTKEDDVKPFAGRFETMKEMIRRGTLALLCLVLAAGALHTGCSQEAREPGTSYADSRDADQGLNRTETYDRLVEGLGLDRAEHLYAAVGQEELELLTYGVGTSNLILLVNIISDMDKLIAMVGSDYPVGSETGLGATRVVCLMNTVDYWMTQNRYDGNLPSDQDTVQRIGDFVNALSLAEINTKLVALINALGVTRNMGDETTVDGNPTDQERLDMMAKLISHAGDLNKVITIMTTMSAATVTTKMKDFILGMDDTENVVEVVDYVTDMSKMVTLLENVSSIANLCAIMNNMNPGCNTKLGYLIENVASIATMIYMIDNIASPAKMSDLINEMEDNSTWSGQVGSAQNWNGGPSGADSGMVRLVGIINGLSAAPNPAKLISIMNQVTDMTKMMRIIQDMTESDDMITLIGSLADPGVNPVPSQNLGFIMERVGLDVIPRMRQLMDGQRIFGNTGDQAVYLAKLRDLISALSNAQEGPLKVAEIVEGVTNIDKMIDLVYDVTVLSNLSDIINGINKGSSAWPNDTAVITLIYMMEHIGDVSKLIGVIDNVAPANVTTLLNNVAAGSQWSDAQPVHTQPTVDDQQAAGKKLASVIDGTADVNDLVFVLNNVSNFGKMADLINALRIASTPRMATLVNNITGTNLWNAGTPSTATGNGKLVNMIDNITNLADVATLMDGITEALKLSDFINQVTNSSLIVGLINAVIADPDAATSDMVGLMNGIDRVNDIPKMARLVTDLNGSNDALIAGLMGPYAADATKGVGYASMVTLMTNLTDVTSAGKLATLILSLNPNVYYLGAPVTKKVGMVRLLRAGVLYGGQTFPGIGPAHTAVMMNGANDPANLAALMNSIGIDQMVPMVGCGDAVGDPGHDGVGPFDPDFWTPCTACNMGW